MATQQPLFPGDSEIDTIFRIFRKLGTPDESVWNGVSDLPDMKPTFPKWRSRGYENLPRVKEVFGTTGIDLIQKLLDFDPGKRISARRALQHPFFEGLTVSV
jgi:serine/threonine protein kinase